MNDSIYRNSPQWQVPIEFKRRMPGNLHDSRTFKGIYDKIKDQKPEMIVMDAGYKTPAIARLLLEDGIMMVFYTLE